MVSDNVWLESIYKYSEKNYFHQNMHNPQKSQIEIEEELSTLLPTAAQPACYRTCYHR